MKKSSGNIILTLLVVTLAGMKALSQTFHYTKELIPYAESGKWGYANFMGTIKIPPQFDSVTNFGQGTIAFVKRNREWFLIDDSGKRYSKPGYKYRKVELQGYRSDLFIVESKSKSGIIDEKGQIILPLTYKKIYNREDYSYLIVEDDHEKYRLNGYGEYILQKLIPRDDFTLPRAVAFSGLNGSRLKRNDAVPPEPLNADTAFKESHYIFSDHDIKFFIAKKETGWGVINHAGTIIIPFIYDSIDLEQFSILYEPDYSQFSNTFFSCFLAKKNDKWGIIINNNKVNYSKFILEPDYTSLKINLKLFPRWILAVTELKGQHGLVCISNPDKESQRISQQEPAFDDVNLNDYLIVYQDPSNVLVKVRKGKKAGYVSSSGARFFK
jgi:hypothetical protein